MPSPLQLATLPDAPSPLLLVEENGSIPFFEHGAYAGPVKVLTVYVPESQVTEVNRNDTNRRLVMAAVAGALEGA